MTQERQGEAAGARAGGAEGKRKRDAADSSDMENVRARASGKRARASGKNDAADSAPAAAVDDATHDALADATGAADARAGSCAALPAQWARAGEPLKGSLEPLSSSSLLHGDSRIWATHAISMPFYNVSCLSASLEAWVQPHESNSSQRKRSNPT